MKPKRATPDPVLPPGVVQPRMMTEEELTEWARQNNVQIGQNWINRHDEETGEPYRHYIAWWKFLHDGKLYGEIMQVSFEGTDDPSELVKTELNHIARKYAYHTWLVVTTNPLPPQGDEVEYDAAQAEARFARQISEGIGT